MMSCPVDDLLGNLSNEEAEVFRVLETPLWYRAWLTFAGPAFWRIIGIVLFGLTLATVNAVSLAVFIATDVVLIVVASTELTVRELGVSLSLESCYSGPAFQSASAAAVLVFAGLLNSIILQALLCFDRVQGFTSPMRYHFANHERRSLGALLGSYSLSISVAAASVRWVRTVDLEPCRLASTALCWLCQTNGTLSLEPNASLSLPQCSRTQANFPLFLLVALPSVLTMMGAALWLSVAYRRFVSKKQGDKAATDARVLGLVVLSGAGAQSAQFVFGVLNALSAGMGFPTLAKVIERMLEAVFVVRLSAYAVAPFALSGAHRRELRKLLHLSDAQVHPAAKSKSKTYPSR